MADGPENIPDEWLEEARAAAREEAQTVYDDLTAVDENGRSITFADIQTYVRELAPDATRREVLKSSMIAMGYVLSGATIGSALVYALSGDAAADASGAYGTQADPLTKVWAHAVGAGDGASNVTFSDPIDAPAIDTESATIGAGDTIQQVEHGTVSFGSISAASDDGWATRNVATSTISFSTTFTSTPRVLISLADSNPVLIRADTITTSDFRAVALNFDTTSHGPEADWVAIGP